MPHPLRNVRGYVCLAAVNSTLSLDKQRRFRPHSSFCSHPSAAAARRGRTNLGHTRSSAAATDSVPSETPQQDQKLFEHFERAFELPGGTLVVKPLGSDEFEATAKLLQETYFSTYNFGPYQRYVLYQLRGYLRAHMVLDPKTVVLVAVLHSAGTSDASTGPATSPNSSGTSGDGSSSNGISNGSSNGISSSSSNSSSSSSRNGISSAGEAGPSGANSTAPPCLVGTAEISFCDSTRTRHPSLNPPADGAFLTNMAVNPAYRRRGIATKMLEAAYDVTALAGRQDLRLHVRVKDAPARELYRRDGFAVEAEDSVLALLCGRDMKQLLHRRI
jgi:ribosomal protein S18 acetylase RimI-like enzyme